MSAIFSPNLEVTVEFAFGSNPLSTTPTWTDVSAYVRSFSYSRGRSGSFGSFQPGRADVVLSNATGRFDPTYTLGAYFPNVRSLVPFRIRLNYAGGGATTVFYGWSESWRLSLERHVDPVAEVSLRDGFKITSLLNSTTQEDQESTSVRIGNLLDYALWPAAWRDLSAGTVNVIFLQTECKSITAAIRQIEDAEGGWFFFDRRGFAVFRNRNHRAGLAVSTTFGPGVGEVPFSSEISLTSDDNEIRNQVSVSRPGGATQTVNDAPSQTSYTIRSLRQLDIPLTSDAASLALANLLLARYKDQEHRIGPLQMLPLADPAACWPVVINRDISDKVRVKLDPGYGAGYQQDLFIEGLAHRVDVSKRRWTSTYNLSQVS